MSVMSKADVDTFAGQSPGPNATVRDAGLAPAGDFGGLITLDPEADKARLCLAILGSYVQSVTGVPDPMVTYIVLLSEFLVDSSRGLLGCIDTSLRSDYSIPAGNRRWTNPTGGTFRLNWTDFQPVSPPVNDTPA